VFAPDRPKKNTRTIQPAAATARRSCRSSRASACWQQTHSTDGGTTRHPAGPRLAERNISSHRSGRMSICRPPKRHLYGRQPSLSDS